MSSAWQKRDGGGNAAGLHAADDHAHALFGSPLRARRWKARAIAAQVQPGSADASIGKTAVPPHGALGPCAPCAG